MLRLVEAINDLFRIVGRNVNPYPVSRLILEHNHFCCCVDYAQLQRQIDRIRVGVNMLIDYFNQNWQIRFGIWFQQPEGLDLRRYQTMLISVFLIVWIGNWHSIRCELLLCSDCFVNLLFGGIMSSCFTVDCLLGWTAGIFVNPIFGRCSLQLLTI